jgi:hypothetical protein
LSGCLLHFSAIHKKKKDILPVGFRTFTWHTGLYGCVVWLASVLLLGTQY